MSITSDVVRISMDAKRAALEGRGLLEQETGRVVPLSEAISLGSLLLARVLRSRRQVISDPNILTSEQIVVQLFSVVDEAVGK